MNELYRVIEKKIKALVIREQFPVKQYMMTSAIRLMEKKMECIF